MKKKIVISLLLISNLVYGDGFRDKETRLVDKIKNLKYAKARPIILKAGYTPKKNFKLSPFGSAKVLYDKGYIEIGDCADSSPKVPCEFKFNAPSSKILFIFTEGEGMYITSAYLE